MMTRGGPGLHRPHRNESSRVDTEGGTDADDGIGVVGEVHGSIRLENRHGLLEQHHVGLEDAAALRAGRVVVTGGDPVQHLAGGTLARHSMHTA